MPSHEITIIETPKMIPDRYNDTGETTVTTETRYKEAGSDIKEESKALKVKTSIEL